MTSERMTTAVVFGGSGTVGREVVRALEARGAVVGATYFRNSRERMKQLDIGDLAAIDRTIDEFFNELGRIDAFINCAAIGTTGGHHDLMDDVDESAWNTMLDLNARPSFFAARRAAMHMRSHGGGNIVLLGSIDGVKSMPSPVHYAASKGAIVAMVKAMAKELGPHNIKVNSVAPGVLERGLSSVLPDELRNEYLKHCGLKRLGRVEEVASLVAWLATENTFINGQTLVVDGAL